MSIDYGNDFPLRENLTSAHAEAWRTIATAGAFWRAEDRVAMVAEARAALQCPLCAERQAAISPFAVNGDHQSATSLGDPVVDVIHRVRTDPGRLTKAWFDAVIDTGLDPTAYLETVSVVATSVIVDTLHQSLGLPVPALPEVSGGEPSGERAADTVEIGAWVPVVAAPRELSDTGLPTVPNLGRAMSLVPSAAALFFVAFRPHYQLKGLDFEISRAQAEFIASRVSALNQCFY